MTPTWRTGIIATLCRSHYFNYLEVALDGLAGLAFVCDRQYARENLGLGVPPLGVVEELKFRLVHDVSCSKVNVDTHFACAPLCELGRVMRDVRDVADAVLLADV